MKCSKNFIAQKPIIIDRLYELVKNNVVKYKSSFKPSFADFSTKLNTVTFPTSIDANGDIYLGVKRTIYVILSPKSSNFYALYMCDKCFCHLYFIYLKQRYVFLNNHIKSRNKSIMVLCISPSKLLHFTQKCH